MNISAIEKQVVATALIAAKTRVAISVVSQILNDKNKQIRISNETANQVIDVAKKLNYMPKTRGIPILGCYSIGLNIAEEP